MEVTSMMWLIFLKPYLMGIKNWKTICFKLRFELPTEAEKKGFNPMSNSSLDSIELQALGWRGLFNAERGFAHTVEIIKQMEQ